MALKGINVVEFAGLAPGPFAGLILADAGASVIRIDRAGQKEVNDVLTSWKRSISLDLKKPHGRDIARKLISKADVLIDPFRPGVLEKLGLGPDIFLGKDGLNHKLVYARLAGFEHAGPSTMMAGHDLNYLASSGVLAMLPRTNDGVPFFPLNIIADFAGGGELCSLGILLALFEREKSGQGQIVNTDMVSGTRYISSFPLLHAAVKSSQIFSDKPGSGELDGGAPFYSVYECKDNGLISVACLESHFYAAFLQTLAASLPSGFQVPGLQADFRPQADTQRDRNTWESLRRYLAAAFATKTRDEWAAIFHGTDSCVVPVLSPEEAAARAGSSVPAPHPVLSRTPSQHVPTLTVLVPGQHTVEILKEIGVSETEAQKLLKRGIVGTWPQAKL